jgi:hypothetical protein
MRVYWDCGRCGKQVEHRWERDRLVFACKNSKDPHIFEDRIITSRRYRSEVYVWLVPAAALAGLIFMLT